MKAYKQANSGKSILSFGQKIFFMCLLVFVFGVVFGGEAWGATYYVDSSITDTNEASATPDFTTYDHTVFATTGGNDSVFKTIADINAFSTLQPGDSVLFRKGQIWREQLTVPASGSEGNPITFGVYGTGENPQIYKTDQYDDWWEHSLFLGGGLELPAEGTPNDNWVDFSENQSGASTVQGDTGIFHGGSTSAKLTADCNGTLFPNQCANINQNANNLKNSTQYYLSTWGRVHVSGNNALVVRIKDVGNNMYLDSSGVWQSSSATAAMTWNGSAVDTWINKTITFTSASSGTTYYVVSAYNFQTGESWTDDWYFAEGTGISSTRIWGGSLSSSLNGKYLGAIIENNRVPKNMSGLISSTLDGYFNRNNYFYYRNDAGNPGVAEIGARGNGIYIKNKSYIIVDGIDIYGVGADTNTSTVDCAAFGSDACRTASVLIENGSNNITVKNSTIVNSKYGLFASNTTSNIVYDNLEIYGCESTGAYNNANGGSVINSKIHDNGRVVSDSETGGDRGGIGSYQGSGLTISGNELYRNAEDDSSGDFEISIVSPSSAFTVGNNYVHDCIQGCIQIAEGGNDSIIAHNIIDYFGTTTNPSMSNGANSGIRIGGGALAAPTGVQIHNNTIVNGSTHGSSTAGITFLAISAGSPTGAKVRNNIFYNNSCNDVIVGNFDTTGLIFSNNNYYKSSFINNWSSKGSFYSTLASWQTALDFATKDANSITANPLFVSSSDFHLLPTSPAINAGTDVGLTTDYEGNPVPSGLLPDIGAYEFQDSTVPITAVDVNTGIYNITQTVVLTCDDGSGVGCDKTYYTTDGTDPTTSSTQYSIPIVISSTTTLNFFSQDRNGNSESIQTKTYTIDTTAPDTTITSNPRLVTNNTNASFEFSATETSTFQCKIDSGLYVSCTTPKNYSSLTDGEHTFYVKATDSVTNEDPTPASYTFKVDILAPALSNLSLDDSVLPVTATSATLALTTNETATCKYSTTSGTDYSSMTEFENTNDTSHSSLITGINSGATYNYYLKCRDIAGNESGESSLSFSIAPEENKISVNSAKVKISRSWNKFKDTLHSKKNRIKLKGEDKNLANGQVKIYRNGKKVETIGIDSDGLWKAALKLRDDFSGFIKIKQYDQYGTLINTDKEKVKVDTEKPKFTQFVFPLTKVSSGASVISFKAQDNQGIDRYKIYFGGRVYNTKNNTFLIPEDTFHGLQYLKIKAYDESGNTTSKQTYIRVE